MVRCQKSGTHPRDGVEDGGGIVGRLRRDRMEIMLRISADVGGDRGEITATLRVRLYWGIKPQEEVTALSWCVQLKNIGVIIPLTRSVLILEAGQGDITELLPVSNACEGYVYLVHLFLVSLVFLANCMVFLRVGVMVMVC